MELQTTPLLYEIVNMPQGKIVSHKSHQTLIVGWFGLVGWFALVMESGSSDRISPFSEIFPLAMGG